MSVYHNSREHDRHHEIEKLSNTAKRYRIPLPEDAGVVLALSRLDSSEAMPPELYELIGSVLAFVHRIDESVPAE